MTEHVNIFINTLKGLGLALKNGFVGFVYAADGAITPEFRTALAYIVIIVSISVITFVTRQIFKKRRNGI